MEEVEGDEGRTVRRLEDVIDPVGLRAALHALAVPHVVEFELARHRHGDLFRAEVARVRHVHFAVDEFELQPHRVIVAKHPDGRHHADVVLCIRHGLALAHHRYAALLARLDHLDIVRLIVRGDFLREFDRRTAARRGGQLGGVQFKGNKKRREMG